MPRPSCSTPTTCRRRPPHRASPTRRATPAAAQCAPRRARRGWRVTLRRAYGGHEKLAGMKDCLLRHGVRSLVNHGKGTTDALLGVDAMDLLHEGRLPPVVAIASSDADF